MATSLGVDGVCWQREPGRRCLQFSGRMAELKVCAHRKAQIVGAGCWAWPIRATCCYVAQYQYTGSGREPPKGGPLEPLVYARPRNCLCYTPVIQCVFLWAGESEGGAVSTFGEAIADRYVERVQTYFFAQLSVWRCSVLFSLLGAS